LAWWVGLVVAAHFVLLAFLLADLSIAVVCAEAALPGVKGGQLCVGRPEPGRAEGRRTRNLAVLAT